MAEIVATPETPQQATFGSMLLGLAEDMKQYDAYARQSRLLHADRRLFEDALPDLGDRPYQQYSSEVAYSGLGALINKNRLEAISDRMDRLEMLWDFTSVARLLGQRVSVATVERERYFLGTSVMNRYGERDGLSKWYGERKGKITEVDLNVKYGGSILLRGRSGRYYSANPLVDRRNGYTPAFTISKA